MSKPVEWSGSNKVLTPPKGTTEEQVSRMEIFTNNVICVSKWELSRETIEEVLKTGCLFISVISGSTQPPIFIGSHDEVRALAVDYGPVWKV